MKNKYSLALIFAACCCSAAQAQVLDKYLSGTNNFTVIADATNSVLNPQDLDFIPGTKTWWVLNYEGTTGSVNIIYDAGGPTQFTEFRRDSHAGHFMIRASALAMGDNGNFATVHEIQNTASPTSTFMGPALWTTDTSIFARKEQSDWEPTTLLGSHLDMLHQSPYGMGVAFDKDNAYWVFDGYNGNICHYDFKAPHIVGGDDHSDGEILRYSDVTVKRKNGIPSHMAVDKVNNWLYIVDGGNNRVIRMKTNNATDAGALNPPASGFEPLAKYRNMTGATVEVVASSGFTSPCGVDYKDGRLIVSDYANGDIIIYDVTTTPIEERGRIKTGSLGVMGVRIDWENKIWYVNRNERKVVRIDNPNVPTSVSSEVNTAGFKIFPNPAHDVLNVEFGNSSMAENMVSIYDIAGKKIFTTATRNASVQVNTSGYAAGTYIIEISNGVHREVKKVQIQ